MGSRRYVSHSAGARAAGGRSVGGWSAGGWSKTNSLPWSLIRKSFGVGGRSAGARRAAAVRRAGGGKVRSLPNWIECTLSFAIRSRSQSVSEARGLINREECTMSFWSRSLTNQIECKQVDPYQLELTLVPEIAREFVHYFCKIDWRKNWRSLWKMIEVSK